MLIGDCENKNEIWERMRKLKREILHIERRQGEKIANDRRRKLSEVLYISNF